MARSQIPKFASLLAPLLELTKKNKIYKSLPLQEDRFQALKKALVLFLALVHYDPAAPTSAENLVGAVFKLDRKTKKWKPLGYCSRKSSESERRRDTYVRVVTAVVYVLKFVRYILLGKHFELYKFI